MATDSTRELESYNNCSQATSYCLAAVSLTAYLMPCLTERCEQRIDDIEDFSVLRRGIPVANTVFGTAQTINSANYVYFKALAELNTLNNPALIDIFTFELLNLHRGQGLDLFWRDSSTCPSETEYLNMVDQKTGGLFRLAIKLMQAESNTIM